MATQSTPLFSPYKRPIHENRFPIENIENAEGCAIQCSTVARITFLVLSLLFIAGSVVMGAGWLQSYLPEIFSTTTARIISAWALGVVGLCIGLPILINTVKSALQKPDPTQYQRLSTSQTAGQTVQPVPPPMVKLQSTEHFELLGTEGMEAPTLIEKQDGVLIFFAGVDPRASDKIDLKTLKEKPKIWTSSGGELVANISELVQPSRMRQDAMALILVPEKEGYKALYFGLKTNKAATHKIGCYFITGVQPWIVNQYIFKNGKDTKFAIFAPDRTDSPQVSIQKKDRD